jgi:predicted nuclease of predicted toxin-antitoxin system
MKLVVDMNLSIAWIDALERRGFTAAHWSTIAPFARAHSMMASSVAS